MLIAYKIFMIAPAQGQEGTVKTWVLTKTQGSLDISSRPPFAMLHSPIEITEEEQLKIKPGTFESDAVKKIADAMYDCVNNLNYKEAELSSTIFCYPCAQISFSDSLVKNEYSINGLKQYMTTAKTMPNGPTYAEAIAQRDPKLLNNLIPQEDVIPINEKTYYLYYVEANADWWEALKKGNPLLSSVLLFAEATEKNTRAYSILFGPKERVSQICNAGATT